MIVNDSILWYILVHNSGAKLKASSANCKVPKSAIPVRMFGQTINTNDTNGPNFNNPQIPTSDVPGIRCLATFCVSLPSGGGVFQQNTPN